MSLAFHQLVAGAGPGDAITGYAFEIQKFLRSRGAASEIFAPPRHIHPKLRQSAVRPFHELCRHLTPDAILLYHFSIGSEATRHYLEAACRRMLCYHNVTPAKYFLNLSDAHITALREGRDQLASLVQATDLASAVSRYNAKDLHELGFAPVEILPLALTSALSATRPHPTLLHRWSDGLVNWLFVGRIVPNKRFEDCLKTFYYYHRGVNPRSRLILVGSFVGNEIYHTYLRSLLLKLDLTPAVVFTGHVSDSELAACYRKAHAFLCLSEHEGFGLPLIEAMAFDVPVFALDRAAVAETLGGAGVLLQTLSPKEIAELVGLILSRPSLVAEILRNQKQRLQAFLPETLQERLQGLLHQYFNVTLAR